MVRPLLLLASLRYLSRHRLQSTLTLLGIGLGVAIVVAVDLANHSAMRSFELSLRMVTGTATHQITGGPDGIPEKFYTTLRTRHGMNRIAPIVTGHVQLQGHTYTLLGIDPFAAADFRAPTLNLNEIRGRRLLLEPNRVAVSATTAQRQGMADAVWVELVHREHRQRVQLLHLTTGNPLFDGQNLLVADIATAQELLHRLGSLDRIDLILEDPATGAFVEQLLPASLTLQSTQRHNEALTQMARAFHINLAAMGLLALLVGGFLIYNTLTFMVLRRREQLGTLRVLGATPRQIFLIILNEALVFGFIGSVAGLALGSLLGQGLLTLVTRTINDLYYVLEVTRFDLSAALLIKGLALGLLTSLVAALLPALEAARAQPVRVAQSATVQQQLQAKLPILALAGLALMLMGVALLSWPSRQLLPGFVALALITLGFSLLIPLLVRALCLMLARLAGPRSALAQLALRNLAASISRTGLAVAALTLAVATSIGVGVMTASFRQTVEIWLDQALASDIYLSLPGRMSLRPGSGLPPALVQAAQQHPAVADSWRNRTLKVKSEWGPLRLMAISATTRHARGFNLKEGRLEAVREAFARGQGILISEPLAYHRDRHPGDQIQLYTPQGPVAFNVLGVFYDYTSSHGLIIMPLALYRQYWQDQGLSALGLYRKPGIEAQAFLDQINALAQQFSDTVQVDSRAQIRSTSLAIFDRTFTITQVLRLLALIVAFIGILSALMALQLERLREFAVLRACGATTRDISRSIVLQTAVLGLLAGLLAIPLGLVISAVLVQVINLRAFGWSLQYTLAPGLLAEALLLALSSALLAGLYPAWRTRRLGIARALNEA